MKTKFLLSFLLGLTILAYSASAADRPTRIESFFEQLKSLVSSKAEQPVNLSPTTYPAGQICGGSTNFRTTAAMPWSDNNTWTSFGATKPTAGSAVTIPAGVHIILDETPPDLTSLSISGILEFADKDLNLTAGWIMVMGTLQVGTPATPFTSKATITLNATNMNDDAMGMGMGTRGILVMGGKLELHGLPPTKQVTKLNNHAAKGATTLSLLDAVAWSVNDQIVVASTDYYSDYYQSIYGSTQRSQITAVSGNTVTIQDDLNAQRWGKLQYLTATGMSLTPGPLPAGILDGTPTVLDERAEVANLTRNIVVQSPDDELWQNNGFGCHIMMMRMDDKVGEAHLNGVEIRRGGQAGKLGRYPFHWHMLSYQGSEILPDVTGQYIRNSVINQSSQRGIVIHGTNGAEISNNVVFDVRGHGVFTEDAVERRNIIDGNLVMKVRKPLDINALKLHETWRVSPGSSGFWVSNPDNTITNNTATDCEGSGFWLAFPIKTFGASAAIPLVPIWMKFGTFHKNTAHSNLHEGIFLDAGESDELGNIHLQQYFSTSDMTGPHFGNAAVENVSTFELTDYSVWKNSQSGIWNASGGARNRRAISADNTNRFFAGRTDTYYPGAIEKTLVVGTSLNYNMNGIELPRLSEPRSGFASYHSSFDIHDNVIVNMPAVKDTNSGAFALSDYYITPVDKGTVRNPGNILINSHPGVRYRVTTHVALGVLWDHHNYWGGPANQDNYYAYNTPFFTDGQTPHVVAPSPEISGAVVVAGPFYGFSDYTINSVGRPYDKIVVTRTNKAGAAVGNWIVENSSPVVPLPNMRHFATHPTGYYYLDFPGIDNVNQFTMAVTNMLTTNDFQVLAVEYSGNYTITKFSAYAPGYWPRPYTAVADFQAVVNAPNGEVYWQDKTNNKVWMKVRGGVQPGEPKLPDTHDFNLYKQFSIQAEGTYTAADPGYTVSFTVKDAGGVPVAGATVDLRGNKALSDANGVATFTHIFPGTNMLYLATKDGYHNATGTISVATANVAKNITLTAVGSPVYTVTFTTKDASGKILEGITVTFNGQTQTSSWEGLAVFKDVAPGTNLPYSAAKVPLSASGSLNVSSADVAQTIVLTSSSSPAPTYTVTFTVKDAANTLMSGASITFNEQTVVSNASGVASFTNVSAGTNLAYTAKKTGYNDATSTLNVGSTNVAQTIQLTAVSSPTYTVTFTVKDAANAPVSGASVTFKGQTVASNTSGVATFTNIAAGTNLPYDAKKSGYNNASGTLTVAANASQTIVLRALGSPVHSVTFTIKDAANVLLSDALVSFNGQTMTTTASGEVIFNSVAPGSDLPYSVSKAGFDLATGVLGVAAADVAQSVVLIPSTVTQPEPNPNPDPIHEPEFVVQLNPRNIFSPNGDGINEIWEVEGIEQQPELRVRIFNGYGQQVYQAQPYTNSWDGGGLPDGVYYYQMQNQQGKPIKKGAITLVR
jgi:gliding motility-associated-like protein